MIIIGIYENAREAFPDISIPDLSDYYAFSDRCMKIYSGNPEWRTVKKTGLYRSGCRSMSLLNAAKVLCDWMASMTFAEQPVISVSSEECGELVKKVFAENSFFDRIPEALSYAYALGGCVFRPYINGGKIMLDCIYGGSFIPLAWDGRKILDGCFCTTDFRNGYFYTLMERRSVSDGTATTEYSLFKSKDRYSLGTSCPLSELYPSLCARTEYGEADEAMFSYFRPCCSNNLFEDIPLGISVFANSADTIHALDTAFDSFSREFILGRKRIIVPSSCVQTVVDIATGEQRQYFDADDEAYTALRCDEERDLKITDNTVTLRVDEHIKAISSLLDLLCFQTGLSIGTLSFDVNSRVKTAAEIISRDSRTADTMRSNKNMLAAALERLIRTVIAMGVYNGDISSEQACECEVKVSFSDGIVTDDETVIENNIKLVRNGLKSKLTALTEIMKCDEKTALGELERIEAERKI